MNDLGHNKHEFGTKDDESDDEVEVEYHEKSEWAWITALKD